MSTTSQTRETEIVSEPDLPMVRITREFDAPVEKVFRAHVDPELFAQWCGPRAYRTRVDGFDCRTGGSYRYLLYAEGEEYAFRGCFHDVRPSELIVQTFAFEGEPDGVALERIDSFEARDAFVASGMEVGVREGYERLDEVLAG
jgi:uncharacterized protein YndB with AHSA1/START domain